MIEPVLAVAPDFRPVWEEFLDEWRDEGVELPLYLLLGDLAVYVAGLVREQDRDQLAQILRVVERWILEGDPYVVNAAVVGLLEDLQNTGLVGEATPAVIIDHLGPEAKQWWVKVDAFWQKGEVISGE